ncbi:MAG TPA: cellulose binding domain-containing protein [Rugosimonospora sp.]|nr:cellulose binding domain-containing protein [Rugosimonospora sp.]
MRTRTRWLAAAATALLAAALAAHAGVASAESNGGVRVMPLGDSITDGLTVPGGYRIGLWQRFTAGRFVVDFVGSLSNGPASLGDHDHEGHSGWRIDQIDANIVGWLRTTTPHTVLLHIGTNDVLQNFNLSTAPGRLSTLIDHITATVPGVEVFVATIIPIGNATSDAAARTFNAAIPGIVQSKVSAGAHVHLVDMHSALTTADLADGIHPNAGGYDKMAAVWFSALQSVPGSIGSPGGQSPSPVPSSRPASPPPSSPPPGGSGACTASYAIVGQWTGGFQATVTVTAGSAAISGWTVGWQFGNGQTVTQSWNTTLATSGAAVTARNVSYNGSLGAGASTQFGFLGSWNNGTNAVPALSCAAG